MNFRRGTTFEDLGKNHTSNGGFATSSVSIFFGERNIFFMKFTDIISIHAKVEFLLLALDALAAGGATAIAVGLSRPAGANQTEPPERTAPPPQVAG